MEVGSKSLLTRAAHLLLLASLFEGGHLHGQAAPELSVLGNWQRFRNSENLLHDHLNGLAFEILSERRHRISQLRTAADWRRRQKEVAATLLKLVDFPEKTPLRPRVLETLQKPGYRIEKLVFESVPGFFVTAALFLPESRPPKTPAILFLSGHSYRSFRATHYQQVVLNLVRKGFIVLAVDPPGQGEMLQYLDPFTGKPRHESPTGEHSHFANQCFLTGSSAYRYFVWNGIRALDYLESRAEVDSSRLGVHGLSGGGFQTAQLAAFDERVRAAAPAAYITSWEKMLEWRGPGDGEQNLNQGLRHGIDYADLLEVRAPKPTLIVSTTQDFVPIQGARDTYREAKRAFQALGGEDQLQMVEDDFRHGYTRKTRERIYAFFQEALQHPGSPAEEEMAYLSERELTITPTGQVTSSLNSETVFSLNRRRAEELAARLRTSRKDLAAHVERTAQAVSAAIGYRKPAETGPAFFRGRYLRDGYSIEQYILSGQGRMVIPVLLFRPARPTPRGALIYLHPHGKSAEAAAGGEIEWFIQRGYTVAAPDLAGSGELGRAGEGIAYLGTHLGRSILGFRAADVVRVAHFIRGLEDLPEGSIDAVARGDMGAVLLHAALLEPSLGKLALIDGLISFRSVVMEPYYEVPFSALVPNVLLYYDLPDLAAALAPQRLLLINARNGAGLRAEAPLLEEELQVVRAAYTAAGAPQELLIRNWQPFETLADAFQGW